MPRKKTPLDYLDQKTLPFYNELPPPPPKSKKIPLNEPFLTLEEKRRWLAAVLRDTSGQHQGFEISLSDKFKALIEDNKLSTPDPETDPESTQQILHAQAAQNALSELIHGILDSVTPPHQQRFTPHDEHFA